MNDSVWRIHGIVLTGEKAELDKNHVPVSLCPPQIPTWNDFRCKRPQKIKWTMALLITCPVQVGLQEGVVGHTVSCASGSAGRCGEAYSVLCKWKVRWDIHCPVQVGLQEGTVGHTSCNKPKSQAPVSSPHWIFAPCLAISHKAQRAYSREHKKALPSADEESV
jgi:hypothetical protein